MEVTFEVQCHSCYEFNKNQCIDNIDITIYPLKVVQQHCKYSCACNKQPTIHCVAICNNNTCKYNTACIQYHVTDYDSIIHPLCD